MISFAVKLAAAISLIALAYFGWVSITHAAGPDIKDLRTRDSIAVPVGNGEIAATFGRSIHRQSFNGRWEQADLTYQQKGNGYEVFNDVVTMRAEADTLTVTNAEGKGIRWLMGTPARIEPPTAEMKDRAKASFIKQGLIWEQNNTDLGTKLTASVATPRGSRAYSFRYELINSAPLHPDGASLRGDGFTIEPMYVIDAAGIYYGPFPYTLSGDLIRFTIDDTAVPLANYPYVIDPTTVFTTTLGTNDGSVLQSGTSYPPDGNTETTLDLTSTTITVAKNCAVGPIYTNRIAVIGWDTSSLPEDVTITDATMTLQVTAVADENERGVVVDWYSDVPPITLADYTNSGIGAAGIFDLTAVTGSAPGPHAFVLATANNTVSTDGITSVRLSISGATPVACTPDNNYVQIDTFEGSVAPTLTLTYTSPLSVTSPTIGLTGSDGIAAITGYTNLIESGDILIVVPYDIDAPDGIPSEIASDEYQFLFSEGADVLQVVYPKTTTDNTNKGYNQGVSAFYFPQGSGVDFNSVAYTIDLNAINGTQTATSTSITWRSDSTVSLHTDLEALANLLEVYWGTASPGLVQDSRLTATGQSYFIDVIPGLSRMVPEFMALSVNRSNPTIATHTLTGSATSEAFWDSTPAAAAFTAAGNSLGMTSMQFRTSLSLLLALGLVVLGLKSDVPGWTGFMAAGVFLIIMVPIGMAPMALGLIIGFIGAVMGVWGWWLSRSPG